MLPVVCRIKNNDYSDIFSLLLQTEIAKRLNAILAQIMPFLSQEVSVNLQHLRMRRSSFIMFSNCSDPVNGNYKNDMASFIVQSMY